MKSFDCLIALDFLAFFDSSKIYRGQSEGDGNEQRFEYGRLEGLGGIKYMSKKGVSNKNENPNPSHNRFANRNSPQKISEVR